MPDDTRPHGQIDEPGNIQTETARRVRAERALHESESRQHAITSAMPDLVFLLDEDGRYLEIITSADELLLADQSELLGKTMHDVMPSEDADKFLNVLRLSLKTGQSRTMEYCLPVARGVTFFEGRTAPVPGTVDGKRAVVFVARDISDRKQIENQLVAAKEEAELANQVKSEFLASMSHELRTPLNAVLGFAQILQSDSRNPLTAAQAKQLEHIRDGGNHLLELINQVLDLARIEADQFDLALEVIDICDVIKECVDLTMPLGDVSNITIIDQVGGGPSVFMLADHLRLKQALINLLSNAVKYNKPNGTITIQGQERRPGFLHLSVVDTGIGIAERDHPNVFKMFSRFGMTAEIAREGSGIGLNVTKLLVEKMGGQIGFASMEGQGSTFWIELPINGAANNLAIGSI